jgi:hypothetical protein
MVLVAFLLLLQQFLLRTLNICPAVTLYMILRTQVVVLTPVNCCQTTLCLFDLLDILNFPFIGKTPHNQLLPISFIPRLVTQTLILFGAIRFC